MPLQTPRCDDHSGYQAFCTENTWSRNLRSSLCSIYWRKSIQISSYIRTSLLFLRKVIWIAQFLRRQSLAFFRINWFQIRFLVACRSATICRDTQRTHSFVNCSASRGKHTRNSNLWIRDFHLCPKAPLRAGKPWLYWKQLLPSC